MIAVDPSSPPAREPGERPRASSRRLDRSPGERYTVSAGATSPVSDRRGLAPLAAAVGIAIGAAVLTVLLGGVLSLSSGLLLVAGASGWLIGRSAAAGGGSKGRKQALGVAVAAGSVVVGQLGLWLFARSQGGALGLGDYLIQTWGLLSPAQLLVAGVAGWWAAR